MAMRAVLKVVIGLVMLFFAYYAGRVGYYALAHAKEFDADSAARYARMVPVDATILVARRHAGENGSYSAHHRWSVHYEYSAADGKKYPGEMDLRDTNSNEQEFKTGDKIPIYYDPAHPADNRTKGWYEGEKEANGKYGTAWIGGFFMLLGLGLLVGGGLLVPRAVIQLLKPETSGTAPPRS